MLLILEFHKKLFENLAYLKDSYFAYKKFLKTKLSDGKKENEAISRRVFVEQFQITFMSPNVYLKTGENLQ